MSEIDWTAGNELALIVMAGERACAIPVAHVAETMRRLPIEPMAGTPAYVLGVSVIRGAPVPVIDLDALIEDAPATGAAAHFVTVKVDERVFAVCVTSVVGVRALDATGLVALPPILRHAARESIEAFCADDAHLLVLLRAMRLVPDAAWSALASGEGGR